MAYHHFLDPKMINPRNVPLVDYHMHTDYTDGRHSVEDMHDAAVTAGLEAILFSEHARKTSGDWFAEFAQRVRNLPQDKCRAFVGTECKADGFDGAIDTSPEVADQCDLIMVSVHRFPGEGGGLREFKDVPADEALDIEYRLSLAVLENPQVDILGHPFGMSVLRYRNNPGEARWRTVIEKAAKHDVAIDISGRYHTNLWKLIEWCAEAGSKVTLGSDAHHVNEVALITRKLQGLEPTP